MAGPEYVAARRDQGGPGDSLSVNRHTGAWHHRAAGAGGGDLVSLWAYVRGIAGPGTQAQAAREARAWLGLPDDERPSRAPVAQPVRTIDGPTPDQLERRKRAEAIWRGTRPFRGSKGETYLRGRGLWVPPDCVSLRYSPEAWHSPGSKFPAMIAAVVDRDGAFLGVHQTFVARDGHGKAPVDTAKKMLGPIRGGAVRLGPLSRKIAVTEGIETGLAVANATGLTVWAALSGGGIANLELPDGVEEVVVCADNDANHVGIEAANKLAERLHPLGVVVHGTMPLEVGTDFADMLLSHGVEAVRARIDGAIEWKPVELSDVPTIPLHRTKYLQAAAPTYADMSKSLVEARGDQTDTLSAFFRRALAWGHNGPPELSVRNLGPSDQIDAPALGLRVGVGIGKTECAVRGLTSPDFVGANVAYLVPTNDLAGEIASRGNALSAKLAAETGKAHPAWKHWKGRGQEFAPGVPMCPRYETARKIEAVSMSVAQTLCHRRIDTGKPRPDDPSKTIWVDVFCPHHPDHPNGGGGCPYMRQAQDTAPAIRVAANALAFIKNSGMPVSSLTVLDESFWQASIEGLGGAAQKLFVPSQAIDHERPRRARLDAQNEADTARLRLLAAINGASELTVGALATAGLTHELCASAADAWAADFEAATILPGDDSEAVAAKLDAFEIGRGFMARKMWRMWSLLRDELAMLDRERSARCDIRSVRMGHAKKMKGGGQGEAGLYLAWSRDFQPELSQNPMLICDATLEPDILARFFPRGIRIEQIDALWPHVTVTQVPDAPTAKTKLVPNESAGQKDHEAAKRWIGEIRTLLDLMAARILEGGPRGLFIANKDAVKAIQAHGDQGPVRNMDAAHFNALAGKDIWRDVPDIVVIGAPVPSAHNLEATARAFLWCDPRPIEWLPTAQQFRRLPDEARAVRMRDGTAPLVRVAAHPAPLVDTVLRAIRDAELIQAIGRARPANRAAATPLRVTVLGGVVLPMTVDHLLPWAEIRPGSIEAALARALGGRGVLPLAAAWLHAKMPDLFPSLRTAEREAGGAIPKDRQSSYRLYLGEVAVFAAYRVGKSKSWSRALIRKGHPDPEGALAEAIGAPLAAFRWVDAPAPSDASRDAPTLPAATAEAAPGAIATPTPPDVPAPSLAATLSPADAPPRFLEGDAPRVAPASLCGRLAPGLSPSAAPAELAMRIGPAHIEGWFTAGGAWAQTVWSYNDARGLICDGTILDQTEGTDMENEAELFAYRRKANDAKRLMEDKQAPASARLEAAAWVLAEAGLLPRREAGACASF